MDGVTGTWRHRLAAVWFRLLLRRPGPATPAVVSGDRRAGWPPLAGDWQGSYEDTAGVAWVHLPGENWQPARWRLVHAGNRGRWTRWRR